MSKDKVDIYFVCIGGYDMPYSRVRGYHFAQILQSHGIKTKVLSFQDHLERRHNGAEMLGLLDHKRLWLNLQAFSRLRKHHRSLFYIQKVHYHAAAPFLLSRLGRNKYVLDYDDWDLDRSPLFQFPLLNQLWFGATGTERITRRIAREAVGCVAASKPLAEFLLEENRNTVYLPTGVNTKRFCRKTKESDGKTVFLWTGQIWGKVIFDNLVFLLECFKRVLHAHVDAQFRIVGRGEWLDPLKERIRGELPTGTWEIIEWVHPDDMPRVLNEASVGLLPLIPDEQNWEWMMSKSPTKLFEYMACGLPSIAMPHGDAAKVLRHGKDGYLAESVEEFSEAMITLSKDRRLRQRMGQSARQHVEINYSLDALGKRLAKWLDGILSGQNATMGA